MEKCPYVYPFFSLVNVFFPEAHMAIRKYRESGSSIVVAGIIAGEVIESGKSDGWQGRSEELSQIKEILSKFNISYVSDLFGEWAYRQRKGDGQKYKSTEVQQFGSSEVKTQCNTQKY